MAVAQGQSVPGRDEEHINQMTSSEKAAAEHVTPSRCVRMGKFLRRNLLLILSLCGVVLGFIIGFAIRPAEPSPDALMWLRFPGNIFLSVLKMTVIPVVVSSVISATSKLDPKENGKMGGIQLGYMVVTNLIGAILGTVLAVVIKPGSWGVTADTPDEQRTVSSQSLGTQDVFADLIRNLFPDNVVRATIQKVVTKYEEVPVNSTGLNETAMNLVRTLDWANKTNILGLIFACLVFGLATGQAKEKGKAFLAFFDSSMAIMIIILTWVLWLAPIGACSLVAASVAAIVDVRVMFTKLGIMVGTVILGLVIHQIIILPVIHVIATRTNPYIIFVQIAKGWFIGFATGASITSMPYMYEMCKKVGYDERIYNFAIPVAHTINADGSALFICVASLFLGQVNNMVFNEGQVVLVIILTTISTLALPSVPSASLVTVVIVTSTLGIPPESFGLLFAVEWFLDRSRSTSNVMSDIFSVSFTHHFCKNDLVKEDKEQLKEIETNHITDETIESVWVVDSDLHKSTYTTANELNTKEEKLTTAL